MLVLVTLMMASVGCSMTGSGTVSTLTLRRSCQVTARMLPTLTPAPEPLRPPPVRAPAGCPGAGRADTRLPVPGPTGPPPPGSVAREVQSR